MEERFILDERWTMFICCVQFTYNISVLAMTNTTRISAVFLAIGVACGAFGAHGLKDILSPEYLMIWEKAVLYHLIHSLGALVLSSSSIAEIGIRCRLLIAKVLIGSVIIFSGSLYLLVLLNIKWLGAITPIGGSGFILGWLLLATSRRDQKS